jgi:plasmid stabilization system protein ParE
MSFKVFVSPQAEADYDTVLNYLLTEWGQKTALDFIGKVEQTLSTISESPELFACKNKKKKIHQCVINPRVILYYKISGSEIELITFFQTRQHPRKLKF